MRSLACQQSPEPPILQNKAASVVSRDTNRLQNVFAQITCQQVEGCLTLVVYHSLHPKVALDGMAEIHALDEGELRMVSKLDSKGS